MVRKSNRDEFSLSVIRTLRERVNGICSNPNCRRFTTGPQETHKDKALIIGQAAHICAGSPGGPRYDSNMTETQRSSIENGIWLCNNCAKLIDRDTKKYTVSLLNGWKRESEKLAIYQLDKPVPGHNDILNGIALITGQNSYDYENIFLHTHGAYEKYLKAIDPRLDVKVDYVDGTRLIKLSHAEGMPPVDLTCTIADENENRKIEEVYLFGGETEINDHTLSITGTPILDRSIQKEGVKRLTIAGNSEDITCRIDILGERKNKILFSINTKGKLYRGTAGLKFMLNAFDGLLSLAWNLDCRKDENESISLYKTSIQSIKFDLNLWNGYKLNELEYFYELFEFCKIYSKEHIIRFNLKIKSIGNIPLDARICINDNKELLLYLEYVNLARIVTAYTGDCIIFSTDNYFSGKQYSNIELVNKIIKK